MLKNLVVVGGGFAGTRVTRALEHALPPDWTLTLVSQENFITFTPLLPEVVGASILPGHVIAPHRQMIHRGHVCMARVTQIDTINRTIHYLGEGAGTMRYDEMVLACGTNANLDVMKGVAAHALPLKTLGDALFLRNRIIARLEQAEGQSFHRTANESSARSIGSVRPRVGRGVPASGRRNGNQAECAQMT